MARATHSFDAGVATGTAITLANSATGGNAFDALDPTSLGSGGAREYTTTNIKSGGLAGHFKAPTVAGRAGCQWTTTIGTQSHIYGRYYAWAAAANQGLGSGPSNARIFSATTSRCIIGVNGTGHPVIRNSSGTDLTAMTSVVVTSAWYRIEFSVDLSTSAAWELRYFAQPEATIWTEAITGTAANFGGTGDTYEFGHCSTDISTEVYLDDIGLDTGGWLGPATNPPLYTPGLRVDGTMSNAAVQRAANW